MGSGRDDLVAAILQTTVDWLRGSFAVQRCTLRLDVDDDFYPVRFESRVDPARTLIGDTEIELRGQPVVRVLSEEGAQVVQDDAAAAFDAPEFQRMLASYGGLGAQIVTPVRVQDHLAGIISLHRLGSPRRWTEDETRLAREAADLVAAVLAGAGQGAPRAAGVPAAPG